MSNLHDLHSKLQDITHTRTVLHEKDDLARASFMHKVAKHVHEIARKSHKNSFSERESHQQQQMQQIGLAPAFLSLNPLNKSISETAGSPTFKRASVITTPSMTQRPSATASMVVDQQLQQLKSGLSPEEAVVLLGSF